jgi:hypothetical protein
VLADLYTCADISLHGYQDWLEGLGCLIVRLTEHVPLIVEGMETRLRFHWKEGSSWDTAIKQRADSTE